MKPLLLVTAVCALTSLTCGGVILQEDFTPAQVGTLPTSLGATYDGGIDVQVVTSSTMNPPISTDHPDGDGHVLRVGDMGDGGALFNFAWPALVPPQSDTTVSAWLYVDGTTGMQGMERDIMLMNRTTTRNPEEGPIGSMTRHRGYFFGVNYNAYWNGMFPTPANGVPLLMKRDLGGNYVRLGEGTIPVGNGWHKFALRCEGTSITGFIDGVEVLSATDTSYSSGYCAMMTYEENGAGAVPPYPYAGAFDNFLWEGLPKSSVSIVGDRTRITPGPVEIAFTAEGVGSPLAYTRLYARAPGQSQLTDTGLTLPGSSGVFTYNAASPGRYRFASVAVDESGYTEPLPSVPDAWLVCNNGQNNALTLVAESGSDELVFPMTADSDVTISLTGATANGEITVSRSEPRATAPAAFKYPGRLLNESLTITQQNLGSFTATLQWAFAPINLPFGVTPNRLFQCEAGSLQQSHPASLTDNVLTAGDITSFSDWFAGSDDAVPVSVSRFEVE